MRKTILPTLIVISFITLAAVPALGQQISVITAKDNINLKEATKSIEVETAKAETIVKQIEDFQQWFQVNRPFKDLVLTLEEKNEIKTRAGSIISTLNELLISTGNDPITTEWLWNEMFETEPGRSTIVSIGRGFCFIPFYDYETFIGVMLRPMWFIYPPIFMGGAGYTGNFNANALPPRLEYGDRMGPHIVRTTMFTGIYINVGELGVDTLFSGTIITLGNARVVL